MRRTLITILLPWLLSGVAVFAQGPDVRVAIDISGSMKRTDPDNLRKPAMELLIKLLPEQSQAGIWTFGQQVNMLVPHQSVSEQWRQQAFPKATEITSVALYTNIGAALTAVSFDAAPVDPDRRTSIILLTDGMVDISPDDAVNARERERILNVILPELKNAGYRIHTIALSEEADQDLMRELSRSTDGISAVAQTANELMSVFLRIFDQAVPQERLPLQDNAFLVDASVEEFTALIFRKRGSATRLTMPDGRTLQADNLPKDIRWHRSDNYDLITVNTPLPGTWQVVTDVGPDSRITVVSNLQLQVKPLPQYAYVNQPLQIEYAVQEGSTPVTDPDFLSLLDHRINVERLDKAGAIQVYRSPENIRPGHYRQQLTELHAAGEYQLQLLVDGKTFRREYVQTLTVASSFALGMKKIVENDQVEYHLKLGAEASVHRPATSVVAHIKNSEGLTTLRTFVLEGDSWALIYRPEQRARYSIDVRVSGQFTDGKNLHEVLPTHYFSHPEKGDPFIEPEEAALRGMVEVYEQALAAEIAEAERQAAAELAAETIVDIDVGQDASAIPPSQPVQWWLYVVIVLANVAMLAAAFWAYRRFIGGTVSSPEALVEAVAEDDPPVMQELSNDSVASPAAAPIRNSTEAPQAFDDESLDALFPLDDDDKKPD